MKNLKIVLGSLSVMLLIIGGCSDDFLVKAPPDSLTQDGYYNSSDRAVLGVNSIYRSVADGWHRELFRINTAVPGEMDLTNTTPLEYNNFAYNPGIQELQMIWTNLYEGITRANLVIADVPDIDMDQTLRNRLVAEARFLRAFNYFTLTNLWGGVPKISEPYESTDDVLVAKSSVGEVYELIIDDLESARAALPFKTEYGNSDLGRATWGAATSLLGKVHLYDNNFEDAESMLGEVIESGRYSLMDEFEHVWHREYENNQESIFELQYADIGGGGSNSQNSQLLEPIHGTVFPTQLAVDWFREDDPRLGYSIFRNGDPYAPHVSPNLAVFDSTSTATGYSMRKGVIPIVIVQGADVNIPIIRYADVLLMYAEAANELNLRDEARDAVNEVRQRPSVNLPELTAAETGSYQEMFDAIVYERTAELMFEMNRFNDLRRWDLAHEVLGSRGYTDRHRYFPIPQLELDINPDLVQNDGW